MSSEIPANRSPNKRGADLTERELLNESVGAIPQYKLIKLRAELKDILGDYKHKYFFEALLISLALATGRTVEGVLEFSLKPNDYEYIDNPVNEGRRGPLLWVIQAGGEKLNLPLPELIDYAARVAFRGKDLEMLTDYLPKSSKDWGQRAYEWLSQHVPDSEYYLRIKVRDTLARKIYERSANPAILTLLVTERHQWRRAESLTFYIDLVYKQTVDIYKDALSSIFGNMGSYPQNTHKKNIDLIGSTVSKVATFMLDKVLESQHDFIQYHNWVARYCLAMMLFCTGHRKSSTPFYSPWDIDDQSQLAFICDKSVVGSEARFVPISDIVAAQIKAYKMHLIDFAKKLKDASPELSRLIHRLGLGGDISTLNAEVTCCGHFGMFFTLNKEFRAKTISTKDIEGCCAELGNLDVRELRSVIVQYFYLKDKSGMQIEALLGHNRENHIFGYSSTWSIKKWADEIRSMQFFYLKVMGWTKIDILINKSNHNKFSKEVMPLFNSSNHSYEGRIRSKELLRLKAASAVRKNLPEDWLYGNANLIRENDIRALKEKVIADLEYDKEAQGQINYAIKTEIDKLRDATVASSTVNLFRTEPGPVEVTASRHLDIASKIRAWWIDDLEHFKSGDPDRAQDYLVKIGLSLIVFDAVLDARVWDALMQEVMSNSTIFLDDCLLIHGRVTKENKVFEKSLIPSPLTQALIIGYKRHVKSKAETYRLEQIKKFVQIKIDRMPTASRAEKRNLGDLMYIFRPWWLIRLPGSLYAIAIGQNSGPAPDLQSELSLMGYKSSTKSTLKALEKTRENFLSPKVYVRTSKEAYRLINLMFERAQGKFEFDGAVSKVQRKKLREIIEDYIPVELAKIAEQQLIVQVFIDFIRHLLLEGGQRKDILKFSTIRTYISSLRPLIDLFWDSDMYEMDAQTYKEVYEKYFEINREQVTNAEGRVQLFHRFLRDTLDAPYCHLGINQNNAPAECRSVVITKADFDNTWNMVDQIEFESLELKNAIRSYLSLGYSYGLRRKEAYGIDRGQILINEGAGMLVKKNKYRDLKSPSAKRLVPSFFVDKNQKKHLSNQTKIMNLSADGHEYLFKNSAERTQLLSTNKIDNYVRFLLKMNTKNIDVVPYCMRHTAATRQAHFSIISPRKIPVSDQVKRALVSEDDPHFFEAFAKGFHGWPFWMDRVAMFLGHKDVDTLLDNYWHTSSIKMAEHTWYENECDTEQLKDPQLASLLGLGRTTLVNMRKRLQSKTSNPISNEILIKHYVSLEGKTDFVRESDIAGAATSEDELTGIKVNSDKEISWILFDKMIVWRLTEAASLSAMKNQALSIGMQNEQIDLLIESYKSLVYDLDFDDFEPIGSELLVKKNNADNGVVRGKVERRAGIANIQMLVETSPEFTSKLKQFIKIWIDRVNLKQPWFVARNEQDVKIIIDVLTKIGVSSTQLEFAVCHGFDVGILSTIFDNFILSKQVKYYRERISRGNPNAIVSELGIRINQEKDSKIGDGRDAHRFFFLVSILMQLRSIT